MSKYVEYPEFNWLMGYIQSGKSRRILLHGPSGTGKTMLVKHVAKRIGMELVEGMPYDLVRGDAMGAPERGISEWFRTARSKSPCILCIDYLDCIFCTGKESLCAAFIDEVLHSDDIVVIGVTNAYNLVDSNVIGILEDSILLDLPPPSIRLALFNALTSHVDLEAISHSCTGFSPADIVESVKRSKTMDLHEAVLSVRATVSAAARLGVDISRLRWTDVGGHQDVKKKLQELVVWQQEHMDEYSRMRVQPLSGLLLYGPPGTGKSILARAAAGESSCHFIDCKITEIVRSEVGESERAIADVFRRARAYSPCIVFIDELQALFGTRGRSDVSTVGGSKMITQLMLEMDTSCTIDGGVVVIGATNRPWDIDAALLRPGRLERSVHVGLPDEPDRARVVNVLRSTIKLDADVLSDRIAARTHGFTGADLRNLLLKAGRICVMRSGQAICQSDVDEAYGAIGPSISPSTIALYDEWSPGMNLFNLIKS